VDAVVHAAAAPHLPHAAALRETLRRRRATGGPAEQTFATLVGLELRPRRLRDASRLWASLGDARGTDGRDALWEHPDMLPTAKDLDDPDGFVHGAEALPDEESIDFSKLDEMLGRAAAAGQQESGTKAPEAKAAEADVPGAKGSEAKDPEVKAPEVKDPEVQDPEFKDPEAGPGRTGTDEGKA
jgi:hypothetical protein